MNSDLRERVIPLLERYMKLAYDERVHCPECITPLQWDDDQVEWREVHPENCELNAVLKELRESSESDRRFAFVEMDHEDQYFTIEYRCSNPRCEGHRVLTERC